MPSVVQHSALRNSANSNNVAITITSTGTHNLLVAMTRNDSNLSVNSVVGSGNNFTQFASAAINGTGSEAGVNLDCWYLLNIPSGITTVTATFSATNTFSKDIWIWEVNGLGILTTD